MKMSRLADTQVRMSGIPAMNVGQVVQELANAYCRLIQGGKKLAAMPSVMLWGAPGVGKSQAIRQMAAKIEQETGRQVHVTDVRLLLFNPIDLRGIPTANDDKTLAVWLKPQIFQMDESAAVVNILFLDEISAAPQSVQAAAYQITLDRVVGEHRLPDNCIVIAAGNRVSDRSVAYKMPKALANRLLHIEIEVSFDSWREWALQSGINPKVLGFLSFRQNMLLQAETGPDDLAYPTPRTWEMASHILNDICDDVDAMFSLIAGVVGIGAASELRTWARVYQELPTMEDIFAGQASKVPKRPDGLYALVSSIAAYAGAHREDLNGIRNAIVYANQLPPDFAVVLMKDLMAIDKDYTKKLLSIPEFERWMATKGSLLNGII